MPRLQRLAPHLQAVPADPARPGDEVRRSLAWARRTVDPAHGRRQRTQNRHRCLTTPELHVPIFSWPSEPAAPDQGHRVLVRIAINLLPLRSRTVKSDDTDVLRYQRLVVHTAEVMAMFSPARMLTLPDVPAVNPSVSVRRQYSMISSRSFYMSIGISRLV